MSGDFYYIQFPASEQIARDLLGEAGILHDIHKQLRIGIQNLYSTGLSGAFLDELDSRQRFLSDTLAQYAAEVDESGQDLLTVVQRSRELDAECAIRFVESEFARAAASPNSTALHAGSDRAGYSEPRSASDAYTTRYGLGNTAWDSAEILSHLVFNQGAGSVAAMAILTDLGLNGTLRGMSIFGGVLGGLMDYGIEYGDKPFSGAAFATEVSSGVLQGLIGMTGVGTIVMLGNTAVQLGGHALTYAAYQTADVLAHGDPVLAEIYRRQANDLNTALDAGNLDNAFDAVTGNIIDILTNNGSIEQNVGEMITGVGETVSGVAQIGFETASMGTIHLLSTAKLGANEFMDLLPVDERFQQGVNQRIDVLMRDIQDLDAPDFSSFQRVATRRIDYFRNVFGL